MNKWATRIAQTLAERTTLDAYRRRRSMQSLPNNQLVVEGCRYLNFAANDYLGLSHSLPLIAAWQEGAALYGVGSGGSGLVTGYQAPLENLEAKLADWLGYERAIVYPSGFSVNQAVIKALIDKDDWIIADKLSHASLLEAAMLAKGTLKRFVHNDVSALIQQLDKAHEHEAASLVITEGVFSMDGDEAPLKDMATVAEVTPDCLWMVDDAHGIGVNGREGRGTCDAQGVKPDLLIVTFGKAFGLNGAALLCSDAMAEYFTQVSRPLIYSTAISPAHAHALSKAVDLIRKMDAERAHLQALIAHFKKEMAALGIENASNSPIQPVIIGSNEASLRVSDALKSRNIWATAIRPPTVPPNSARIRITLNAAHSFEQVDQLIEAMHHALSR